MGKMTLRRKSGSMSGPQRSRRLVIPPKKDDLSVLTWKEQQMIEKAQLASLRTSTQKRLQSTNRGRPRKTPMADEENDDDGDEEEEESDSSNDEDESESNDEEVAAENSDDPSTPPPVLSPLSIHTSGSKMSTRGGRGRSGKNDGRRSSNRRSPSGQSLGSLGSFPELLSPYLPTTGTSGGFAARKSAYTGVIDDGDESEFATRRRTHLLNGNLHSSRSSSEDREENEKQHRSPRRVRAAAKSDSVPSTEDFITYLILKGVNCVPDDLKYIGDVQWETMRVKRRSNSNSAKKHCDSATSAANVSISPVPSIPAPVLKPEQAWAKKAVERAKRSLVNQRDKQRPRSVSNVSANAQKVDRSASNGKVRRETAKVRERSTVVAKSKNGGAKRNDKESSRSSKQRASTSSRNSREKGLRNRKRQIVSKRQGQQRLSKRSSR